jgi:light-regulated signal transduction histidine kinase (bacteriophytochrome)
VIEAASGKEALDLAAQHKPAMILLDVNLPDMTGFEVCRAIREDPSIAFTTILHISASSVHAQHQVEGLDSGADGYIVEPVEPAILIATVNAFMRTRLAEEALRKSAEEQRWFAYRVGHDLSEPLRTIAAYSTLLKQRIDGLVDPEALKFLDFIAHGAVKIRSFMDGLLQYTQADGADSQPKSLNCNEVLSRVEANLDSAVKDSGAIITHDPLPVVHANEQLEHVFQNLIGNAIKYHRPGVTPEIHVSASATENGWLFSVSDNGLGVDKQYHNEIFEIFQRLSGQDIPGNGIGLALSKKIVEAHGGKIWVESESARGSVFFFRIPASAAISAKT